MLGPRLGRSIRMTRQPSMAALIFGIAASITTLGHAAFGLGVLVSESTDPNIKASRTIIARTSASTTFQATEINFESSNGSGFSWILPVKADGDELIARNCQDGRFDDLAKLAQPRILHRQRGNDEEGCGGASIPVPYEASIGAFEFSQNDPPLIQHRIHAPFDDIEELELWLGEEGEYVLQDSNRNVLRHYVASTYHFVAVQVSSAVSTGRICIELEYTPPAQREYDHLLPLKSGSVSADVDDPVSTEILIYAIEEGTVRPLTSHDDGALYSAVTINLHQVTVGANDYDTVFEEAVGDPPGFVMEYSGQMEQPLEWTGSTNQWLTRLRTRMTPSELTGPDLPLQIDDPEDVSRDYSIIVARAESLPSTTIALCAVALVGVLTLRRRFGRR